MGFGSAGGHSLAPLYFLLCSGTGNLIKISPLIYNIIISYFKVKVNSVNALFIEKNHPIFIYCYYTFMEGAEQEVKPNYPLHYCTIIISHQH
jgi:hypothetical protein